MPLIGEQLVEEWLNRLGFFTIRGLRDGVDEIDLLGIRSANNGIEGWHVEVQISFRPVAYVTKLTKERARSLGKGRTSAWTRPPDVLSESVDFWVENKFRAKDKANARNRAWPGVDWRFVLVHGVVKHEDELAEIQKHGIVTIPLHQALTESFAGEHRIHLGASGADFADVISYYESQKSGANFASPRLGG